MTHLGINLPPSPGEYVKYSQLHDVMIACFLKDMKLSCCSSKSDNQLRQIRTTEYTNNQPRDHERH